MEPNDLILKQSKIEQMCYLTMKLSGVNLTDEKLRILDTFLSVLALLSLSVLTMIQVFFHLQHNVIEDDAIQAIMGSTALQVTFMKLVQIIRKRKQVYDLFRLLQVNISECAIDLEIQDEKGIYSLIKALGIFSLGSVFLAFLQTNVLSTTDLYNCKALYPITVPEDRKKYAFVFYCIIALQVIGGVYFTIVNTATITMFAHSVNFVCCQMKLLAVNFNTKNVENHKNKAMSVKTKYTANMQYYIHLLGIVERLQSLFSMIIFAEFFSSQFLSCILVTITIKKIRNGMVLQALQHIALIPTLTFMSFTYFYLGNKLTNTSFEVRIDVYPSNWYNKDSAHNKMLCILLERMKKPMVMLAASIIPVTLNSFLKAIQAGYSYFNFLDAMYRRQL